jgi:hypothetical protein
MAEQNVALVGYCGLNCEVCFGYRMTVSEAAKSLRRELRAAKLKSFWQEIPMLGEYELFKKALDGLAMLRCPKGCRSGGGNPWCKIRKCSVKKGFIGCWECTDFETCDKLPEVYLNNLKRIKKVGIDQFIQVKK